MNITISVIVKTLLPSNFDYSWLLLHAQLLDIVVAWNMSKPFVRSRVVIFVRGHYIFLFLHYLCPLILYNMACSRKYNYNLESLWKLPIIVCKSLSDFLLHPRNIIIFWWLSSSFHDIIQCIIKKSDYI